MLSSPRWAMLISWMGTLEDDLVGADAVHLVVDAVAALLQFALDLQGGELVGHHADAPAVLVRPGPAIAVGEDLVRRLVLVALAERAEAAAVQGSLGLGRDRPLGPVGGDDDPAADNRILAQFRHRQSSQCGGKASQRLIVDPIMRRHHGCFLTSSAVLPLAA